MKKAIAMRWADALESGEYPQAQSYLRTSAGFCCLGVLCNLHAQDHPKFAATQIRQYVYDGSSNLPSQRVQQWAGMHTARGELPDGSTLTQHNDGFTVTSPKNFKQIAALIRKHWRQL